LWGKDKEEVACLSEDDYRSYIDNTVGKLEKELALSQKQRQNDAVASWRQRMQSGIGDVSKWLRNKIESPVALVLVEDGRPAQDMNEATEFIRKHRQKTWACQHYPNATGVKQQIARDMAKEYQEVLEELKNMGPWPDPSEDELYRVMRKARGAASSDTWTGREIANLSRGVVQLFRRLA